MTTLIEQLKERCIAKVICIDDENAVPPISTIEDVVCAVIELKLSKLRSIARKDARFEPLISVKEGVGAAEREEAESALTPIVEQLFEDRGMGSQERELIRTTRYQGHSGPTAKKLNGTFPKGILKALSFAEWRLSGSEIVSQATAKERLLLLVDERNIKEPDVDLDGVKLLTDLWLNHCDSMSFIDIIIVTSNCQPRDEFAEADRILKKVREAIPVDEKSKAVQRAFVLSKNRLDDGALVNHFVVHLNRLQATQLREEMTSIARVVFEDAIRESITWLEQIPLSEFQGSVFASSENEGSAEIDTLLRLVSIRQRVGLEMKLKADDALKKKIAEMRRFSLNRLDADADHVAASQSGLRALRRQEFERSAEQVNSLMEPIASGDVFKLTSMKNGAAKERTVILLANPCDLVLRSNGRRKLRRGWLVELKKDNKAAIERMEREGRARAPLTYVLTAGHRDEDDAYIFHNANVESVDLDVLDLCWTNALGSVFFESPSATAAHEFVLPAQQKRLLNLAERLVANKFTDLELWGEQVLLKRRKVAQYSVGPVQVLHKVAYPISRIWRLAPEFSSAVLLSLSQSIARPAFELDYMRVE